jgi:hypothetical protein
MAPVDHPVERGRARRSIPGICKFDAAVIEIGHAARFGGPLDRLAAPAQRQEQDAVQDFRRIDDLTLRTSPDEPVSSSEY